MFSAWRDSEEEVSFEPLDFLSRRNLVEDHREEVDLRDVLDHELCRVVGHLSEALGDHVLEQGIELLDYIVFLGLGNSEGI